MIGHAASQTFADERLTEETPDECVLPVELKFVLEAAKLAKQTYGKASRSKGPCITSWLHGSRNAVIRKALSASLSDGAGIEPKECLARLADFHDKTQVRATTIPGSAMHFKKALFATEMSPTLASTVRSACQYRRNVESIQIVKDLRPVQLSGDGLNPEDCTACRSAACCAEDRRSNNFNICWQTKSPDVLWDHPGL